MNGDRITARQVSAAVLAGGLSHGAALAAQMDWRWVLLFSPPLLLLGYGLVRKGERGILRGRRGRVLSVCLSGWAVLIMAWVLRHSALRLELTNGAPGDGVWILLLLAIPLLRMGWRRGAVFFRAAALFCPAVLTVLAGLLLFGLPRVEWQWLAGPPGDWRDAAAGTTLTLLPILFCLPYIYKVEGRPGAGGQAALAVSAAAVAVLTAGVLSPALAARLQYPMFTAAAAVGESLRGDGLVSALWLLSDLTLVGLLSRSWGGRFGPVCAVGLAVLLVLTGVSDLFSPMILGSGTAVLALFALLLPVGKGQIVVSSW